MRAPLSGWLAANSARRAMSPGISFSARRIWCLPDSARERSATLNSIWVLGFSIYLLSPENLASDDPQNLVG